MFATACNLAKLSITLSPEGAFLVKAREGLDPTRPEMEFVRLATPHGTTIYVPGSSIKGVVRSAVEAFLRGFGRLACAADDAKRMCPARTYQEHCDACRMFGSTRMAGRVSFGDLMPWPADAPAADCPGAIAGIEKYLGVRPGVAIDRRTGQARGGALFEMEVLSGGHLYGEVVLRNFALWQLAFLLFVFERVDDGTLRVGFGKSRGLGRVRLRPTNLQVDQFGALAREPRMLRGAQGPGEDPNHLAVHVESLDTGLGRRFTLDADAILRLRPDLTQMLKARYALT